MDICLPNKKMNYERVFTAHTYGKIISNTYKMKHMKQFNVGNIGYFVGTGILFEND